MATLTHEQLVSELEQYYGTEHYYKAHPFSQMVITDGVKAFAEKCSCFWAIDEVALANRALMSKDSFVVIKFNVSKTGMNTMTAQQDTDQPIIWQKKIKDVCKCIPQGEYKFYLIDNVMLLPSEY